MAPNDKLKPLLDNAQYAEQSRKSDTSAIIFSVLITAIVFSALSFFWQKNDSDNNTEIEQLSSQVQTLSDQVAILQLSLTTTNAIVDNKNSEAQTASFNTYANTNYGYSFEYSTDWNAATNTHNNNNALFGKNATNAVGLGGVEISSWPNSLNDYIDSFLVKIESRENVKVGNLDGIKISYQRPGTDGLGYSVFLKDGGHIVNIYLNSDQESDLVYFNQIVNSFKLK